MESAMMGKPCRARCSALIARQYHDDVKGTHELTPYLAEALRILSIAAEHMPCRDIFVRAPPEQPVIIYTDAAAVGTAIRIGILAVVDGHTYVHSTDVPSEVVATWAPRGSYINLGELLAGPVVLHLLSRRLRGRAIIWFVDNVAAAAAMSRAASSSRDGSHLAGVMALSLIALRARAWFEYVESASNPSDVLSRDAYNDATVKDHISTGRWIQLPGPFPWGHFVTREWEGLWHVLSALGC